MQTKNGWCLNVELYSGRVAKTQWIPAISTTGQIQEESKRYMVTDTSPWIPLYRRTAGAETRKDQSNA